MKYGKGIFAGAVTTVLGAKTAAAQFVDTASAGNGGVATASATAEPFQPATSTAVATSVTPCCRRHRGPIPVDPQVYGGDCLNTTGIGLAVDDGTGIADASGGNYNLAFVS